MRVLFVNPKNYQGASHSRKGMYAPLGILSICTVLKGEFGDLVDVEVMDEDVEDANIDRFEEFDIVSFYSTTFNYRTCTEYAKIAKSLGKVTVIGGPHPSALPTNVMNNQTCFDYLIKFEAEAPFVKLVKAYLKNDMSQLGKIHNLLFRDGDQVVVNRRYYEARLNEIPFPSREFVPFERYVQNYQQVYPERGHIRPGSLFSSKGCQWRDKTEGCVFCARLEEGVRFRSMTQIWEEIRYLKHSYGVNLVWDISDDNLADKQWIINFLDARPHDLEDMSFFIYSRVGFINPALMPYLRDLNVEEVFLGVESGDNRVLRKSFKGQSARTAFRAVSILSDHDIKYFPSFILGLPEESEESMQNTLEMCQKMADLGGLDRLGCTILMPIPGSPSFDKILKFTEYGKELEYQDDINLPFLEKYWIKNFTFTDYETAVEYRDKINEVMKDYKVFGARPAEETEAVIRAN